LLRGVIFLLRFVYRWFSLCIVSTDTKEATMTAEEQDCRTAFELMGFNEEHTGGNCTAWRMGLDGGREVLVTDGEASSVLDMAEPCTMYLMVADHGEPVQQTKWDTAEKFIAWLDRECGDKFTAFQVMERCFA
jgi:hypothetical protein